MSTARNTQTIQAYFEELARRHVDLRHDPAGKKAFFKLEGHGEVTNARTPTGQNMIVVLGFPGNAAGEKDPGRMMRQLVLRIAARSQGHDEASRATALQVAEAIMFDLIGLLRHEAQDDDCVALRDLDEDGFEWEEIDPQPWLDNHFGWDLVVRFRTSLPGYNPNKWLD